MTHNSTCSIHSHNPTGMWHGNTELKNMWQNKRGGRLQKETENGRERQKKVVYERQNEGQRHKSGKRRPRVRWGRGKLSMIAM